MRYHLGVDIGATKTDAMISDETGMMVGMGSAGSGNWECVGYDGLSRAAREAGEKAMAMAGVSVDRIVSAGMGIAGFDWPSQHARHQDAIRPLGLGCAPVIVNDASLGIPAGAPDGWGVSIVSGTSCNCRGWTRDREREGRMIGGNNGWSGEAAGGLDIVKRAMQAVAFEWTRRGPATALTPAFMRAFGEKDLSVLVEKMYLGLYKLDQTRVTIVFDAARQGDAEALEVIRWAGTQLGDMACGVIRQLDIQRDAFDVVLIGSIFRGHPLLTEALGERLHATAPSARLAQFTLPPVVGAVLLAMQSAGEATLSRRARLLQSVEGYMKGTSMSAIS